MWKRKLSNNDTWIYQDELIFKNNRVYQLNHDEGRAIYDTLINKWVFEYDYRDHLGNLRVSFRDSLVTGKPPVVTQIDEIDPTGLSLSSLNYTGVNKNNFGFINRETFAETGWINLNNRFYMPEIMRFGQTDPIIEGQEHLSLYQYGWNNPVRFSDPNGDCPKCFKALAKTAIKSVIKGKVDLGEVYDVIDAGKTLLDPNASLLDKGLAVFDVVSPISTKEAKAVGNFLGVVDDANDAKKAAKGIDKTSDAIKSVDGYATGSHEALNAAKLKDSHHIIQDAAVRDLPNYSRKNAPAVQLEGPSTKAGTPHYNATQAQRQIGGGTYASERRMGYRALREAGVPQETSKKLIRQADDYFKGIGVTPNTQTRIPGNRN